MIFSLNIDDRKVLVKRLETLVGIQARYTRLPRCAYEVGVYSVEKDGHLEVDGSQMDAGIISVLISEGLIVGSLNVSSETPEEMTDSAEESETSNVLVEAEAESTSENTEAVSNNAGATDGAPFETEADVESNAEIRDEGSGDMGGEGNETNPNFEETPLDAEAVGSDSSEHEVKAEGDYADYENQVKPNIEFPMARHSARTLRNLINLLHSRGSLISKATDGEFGAEAGLVEKLKDLPDSCSVEEFRRAIADYEEQNGPSLCGLTLSPERLSFSGFPATSDTDEIQAFTLLASLMNKQSLSQKRIQAKPVDETNEKYAFRIWITRIGMDGRDYKQSRKILLDRLSGHTAFRTQADADRWKERQMAKRDELRAAKEATANETAPSAEDDEAEVEQGA